MPTTLLAGSNVDTKMRWQETYVSEGLNKKLLGVVPRGIIRGGKVASSGAGFGVTVDLDPISGDAVYSYVQNDGAAKNGIQVTYRHKIAIPLDLVASAGATVYIALYVNYTISAATVVEWRTYTEAELFTAPVPEAGDVIVVAKVVVPAVGPIPQSNITYDHRVDGGLGIATGARAWEQVVENGDFSAAASGTIIGDNATGSPGQEVPGWEFFSVPGLYTWSVSTTSPASPPNEMQIEGVGGVPNSTVLSRTLTPVEPGAFVKASVDIRSELVPAPGAAAFYGVRVEFMDATFAVVSSMDTGSTTLTGTNAYATFEKTGEVPTTALWMQIKLIANSDLVAFAATNLLAFDNVRVWVQKPGAGGETAKIGEQSVLAQEISLAPRESLRGGTLAAYMAKVLSKFHLTTFPFSGSNIEWFREQLKAPSGLGLWVKEMFGGNLIFTPSQDNVAARNTAQIQFGSFGNVGSRDLITDYQPLSGSGAQPWGRMRVYQRAITTTPALPGWDLTYNAFWDESTSQWSADDGTIPAWRVAASEDGIQFYWKSSTGVGWSDNLWEDASLQSAFGMIRGASRTQLLAHGTASARSEILVGNPHIPLTTDTAKSGDYLSINAKTIPSGWVSFTTDGAGGVVIDDGFNISNASFSGSSLSVSFLSSMANAGYSAVGTVNTLGSPGTVVIGSKLVTGFFIQVFDSSGALVNLSTTARTISVMVFGELA